MQPPLEKSLTNLGLYRLKCLLWKEIDKREQHPYQRFEQPSYEKYLKDVLSGRLLKIEIAGPTEDYFAFPFINKLKLSGKLVVSNINIEHLGNSGQNLKTRVILDAKAIPFRRGSLGLICASCLNFDVMDSFVMEAQEALAENGLMIIQGLERYDIERIKEKGFDLQKSRLTYGYGVAFSKSK